MKLSLLAADQSVLETEKHLAIIVGVLGPYATRSKILYLSLNGRRNRRNRQSSQAITYAWPTFSQPSFGLAALVLPDVHYSPIIALILSTNPIALRHIIWHMHVASHAIV